jgi:transcriptional regulator with XRE-family HTH domain
MKPLTPEQLESLRRIPLGIYANKVGLAIHLTLATQLEIEAETGIAQPQISDIVRGKYSRMNVDTARKLAAFFGVSIEDLFPAPKKVSA